MAAIYYVLAAYLLVMNVYTFSLMGMDKKSARKQRRRVPEKKLFLLSAAGGAAGIWLAMKAWRHKTKHRSFTVGIPFLFGLNILLVLGALWLIGTALNS